MSARFRARRRAVSAVVDRTSRWADGQVDVCAVVVVGSYAFGRPRMSSDVDLVILSDRLEDHLTDLAFIQSITPGGQIVRREMWGPMHERRVRARSGLLVEFGLTTPDWAALPLDRGTAKVLSDGCKIVVDDGTMAAAISSLGRPAEDWHPIT